MKNQIIIDVDTDRESVINFGKPTGSPQPQNKEEAAAVVLNDIACLSEAITTLIMLAGQNGYGDIKKLVEASIKTINSVLDIPVTEPTQTETDEPKTTN